MTDFESEYCGWDSAYSEWQTDGTCISAEEKTCNECRAQILPGNEYHKWLSSEGGDHDDLELGTVDWEKDTIAIEDHGEGMDHVVVVRNYTLEPHIMCEQCYDLLDSLIANGRQPHFHEIHNCHNDWKNHVRAENLSKKITPLVTEINKLLRGTDLESSAGELEDARWQMIENVRSGI